MIAFRKIVIVLFAVLLAAAAFRPVAAGEERMNLSEISPGGLMYGIIMTGFYNRHFENMEKMIADAVTRTPKGDPVRIQLVMALAKLGRPQAGEALSYLDSWKDDYPGLLDGMRLASKGELHLYYLDQPEEAAESFEAARIVFADQPHVETFILSSLFAVYSSHPRTFDREKAGAYLEQMSEDDEFYYPIAASVDMAMRGEKDDARAAADAMLAEVTPETAGLKVYLAPILGWLGDVEGTVACLEEGLKTHAPLYAPAGFRAYCDFLRASPAYDSMREDERFVQLWERLHAYEPEPAGTVMNIPPPSDEVGEGQ